MKRSFMILLASMLLVFSLTACGRRDNNAQTSTNPPAANQETVNGTQNNGPANREDALTGDNNQNNTTGIENGTLNESANTAADSRAGVSYEQMLRNGRVHDTDGLLNDGENAVSNIVRGTENAVGDIARGTKNALNGMTR